MIYSTLNTHDPSFYNSINKRTGFLIRERVDPVDWSDIFETFFINEHGDPDVFKEHLCWFEAYQEIGKAGDKITFRQIEQTVQAYASEHSLWDLVYSLEEYGIEFKPLTLDPDKPLFYVVYCSDEEFNLDALGEISFGDYATLSLKEDKLRTFYGLKDIAEMMCFYRRFFKMPELYFSCTFKNPDYPEVTSSDQYKEYEEKLCPMLELLINEETDRMWAGK